MTELPQTPEALLRQLEWTVLRRLDGLLHGANRTLFRGAGLDLADVREYQLHDDVRHIDWNVTARLQALHVRQYLEEREIVTWFLLDLSPSVEFGSGAASKREVLQRFVAVLARVLTRHGNCIGAMICGAGIEAVIPPRTGRRHVLHFLHELMGRPALPRAPRTNLGGLLRAAGSIMQRRSLVFLVSDFISTPGWSGPLAQIARRHEVVAVRLYDPVEQDLPVLGMVVVQDAETGEQMFLDTRDRGLRRRYAEAAGRREAQIRSALANAGVDALELSTTEDLLHTMLRFAALRRRRCVSGHGLLPQFGVLS